MTKARDLSKLLSTSNGKIAGSNLDVSFENISDTGTEGTKVASGTTAQRGTTTGQWRYNSTTNFFEGRAASGDFLSLEPTPTVASVDVTEVDSQAGGNQTIVITGTNFTSGAVAAFIGSSANFNASTTTVDSATQITAVAPKSSFLNAQEPYKVKVTSATGIAGTSATGLINVDTSPTWSTASGQIGGSVVEGISASTTVSATDVDGDTIAYSVQSGSLPSGLSLNSSSGVISGTPSSVSSDTTSSFTLRATANTKTVDRAFNIIVKESIISNHSYSNWGHVGPSGNRSAPSTRYITSSTSGASGYLYSVSSENASTGEASHQKSWLTSDNNPGSGYWRGQGSAPQQDTLELWFAGDEVTITNIQIHSYNAASYEFDSVKLEYWNGSGWTKTSGIGSYNGSSSGWSWGKSGSNNRTNRIQYTGSSASSFKSTNWRFVYGTGGNDVHNGSDVVHQTGANNLHFTILG